MKNIVLFFVLLISSFSSFYAFAQESVPQDSPERIPFELAMVFCMSAVIAGDDAARVAEMDKLYELPEEKAVKFLGEKKGRAFASPKDISRAVMAVPNDKRYGCSVLVRALDFDTFWTIADFWYGPESPFKVVSEKNDENSREKVLKGDFKGNVMLIVRARKKPENGQIQGQIVVARTAN